VEGGWPGGAVDVTLAEGDEDEEVSDENSEHMHGSGVWGC
jgi:hypothetical protein